MYLITIVW